MKAKYFYTLQVVLAGLIVLVSPTIFAQRAWYVDNSSIGDDGRNGSSPAIPVPDDGITGPKKTLSGFSSGAIEASNAGDTICITNTGIVYDTASGEQSTITVTKNLTFRSNGGRVSIGSVFQVGNTLTSPNNTIIFDSGKFTLSGGLTLTSGVFSIEDTLIISDSSLITVDAGVLETIGSSVITFGNEISVQYVPSAADYISSGVELPSIVRNLSFTRLGNTVNRTTTLNSPVTITGVLAIKNNLTTINTPFTLNGNLVVANDAFPNATTPITIFNTPLRLAGSASTTITVPSSIPATGMPLNSLTLAKTDSTSTVTLLGGNLDLSAGVITFTKGIFRTVDNILYLAAPTTGAVKNGAKSQGFVWVYNNKSHVVGNVAKRFVNDGSVANSTEAFNEFPVGDGIDYRPAMLTFNPINGIPTTPNATIVISHVNSNPGGVQGLPIIDGVETGVNISRYPSFYWRIYTLGNVSPSILFDLGLTGGNYANFDDAGDVRIIRRHGAVADVNNDWLLQGNSNNYDNEINSVNGFTAISRNSVGGLRTGGAIFTYGLRSGIIPPDPCPMARVIFDKVNGMYVPNPYKIPLTDKFKNYVGTLTYLTSSTNPSVVIVAIVQDTLQVTMLKDGTATITIKATDSNNDFAVCSFEVEGGTTCCDDITKVGLELPKEFTLSQNYPNPFNPMTNIIFGVPHSSSVKIAIFDLLGREITTLVNSDYMPGYYSVPFDGGKLASGTYIYRMISMSLSSEHRVFTYTKKLILMK